MTVESEYNKAVSQVFDAHRHLETFSKTTQDTQENDINRNAELASLALMQINANDVVTPQRMKRICPPADGLELTSVTLAAIGFNRNDIAPAKDGPDDEKTFYWDKSNPPLSYVRRNPEAHDECLYDFEDWKARRLSLLKEALDAGATIISLGEFDYPPDYRKEDDTVFNKEIQDLIDRKEYSKPVFVVAGTRHEIQDAQDENTRNQCYNFAKIFVNEKMDKLRQGDKDKAKRGLPINHAKLVPAESAEEFIDTPFPARIGFYQTYYGNIAVLICKDAYSPNVVLSMIHARKPTGGHSLDYVIVPAYNPSRKFYYACQMLSYLSRNTVMMVDTCGIGTKKRDRITLFVCGRRFMDIKKGEPKNAHPEEVVGDRLMNLTDPDLTIWSLNLDYVNTQKQVRNTPVFDEAFPMTTVAGKAEG